MANKYYDNSDTNQRFQPGVTVRSDEVDNKLDQVSTGFENVQVDTDRALKFPAEAGVSQEFSATPLERRRKVLGFDENGKLVLSGGFNYRGDWTADTKYLRNDVLRYAGNKNLYVVQTDFTSGTTFDTANLSLAVNLVDVEAAKDDAQTAAGTATTKAGEAATSASGAATSESKAKKWAEEAEGTQVEAGKYSALHHAAKAAASATSSADSATASSDSKTQAAQLLAAFQDIYHGPSDTPPEINVDEGDLYFDTGLKAMQVYTGTNWINASSVIQGIRLAFEYVTGAGQTVFSGVDRLGEIMVFDTSGSINVYRNGVRLAKEHFTADPVANEVTVPSMVEGDILLVEAFGNFTESQFALLDPRYLKTADVATTQEAKDAVAGKFPDAAGVHAAFGRFGLGSSTKTFSDVDPDSFVDTGTFFILSTTTNQPPTSGAFILVVSGGSTSDGSTDPSDRRVLQTAIFYNSQPGIPIYNRTRTTGGVWGEWVRTYNEQNILGTVSQSSGIPTGAIIETIENANGTAIKLANGTLICFKNITINTETIGINNQYGSTSGTLYSVSGGITFTYPVGFSVLPNVSCAPAVTPGMDYQPPGFVRDVGSTSFNLLPVTKTASSEVRISWTAIGRWY